jgi:hypothetical protein
MKNKILVIFFALFAHFAKAQFNTFILAQDENIEISVKYKEKVSFIDVDCITLAFTNKTAKTIILDSIDLRGRDTIEKNHFGFNFHFDNQDYTNDRGHYMDKNWQKESSILAANTTIIKNENSYFYDKNFNDFYAKIKLNLSYSIDNQVFKLKNNSIFFIKTTKLKEIEEKEIVEFINKNIINGGIAEGGDRFIDLFTIKGNIWSKIDNDKFLTFLEKPNLKHDYTVSIYTKLIKKYGSEQQIRQLNQLFIKKIKENSTLIFKIPAHLYWDSSMMRPLLDRYEKDTSADDIFCYASILASVGNLHHYRSDYKKLDSSIIKEIYRITKNKEALFFKNDKTKKDTLSHFKEWMLILTFTHSKEWIPYLKTFLKDTSTVLDHNESEPSHRHFKTDWCYNRSKENMRTNDNGIVCGDVPQSVRDFAITTIYHLQGKNICTEVGDAVEKLKLATNSYPYLILRWDLRNDTECLSEYNRKQRLLYDYLIAMVDKESEKN